MNIVFLLLPLSLLLALLGVAAYLWLLRSGQLDDLETPAMRMLWDDQLQSKDSSTERATPSPDGEEPQSSRERS